VSGWIWLLIGMLVAGPLWVLGTLYGARRIWQTARRLTVRARGHEHLAELGQLAGGLAHEIKNPLSTINVNLKLLAEDLARDDQPANARLLRRLNSVQNETARLKDILDDFLRFAGRLELTREVVDLRRLVQELSDFFAPQADTSRIVMRTYLGDSPVRVSIDANLIKQALLNLLINAQQAMQSGGELIVKVGTQRGQACIEVIDTGVGIPKEDLARVFQVYYSTKATGSGLGLPTTQRIIREHGGTIRAQSEPGKGTRFVILLPLEN